MSKKPVVVITGASSGIGRATALRFAQKRGARLVLAGRRRDALDSLAAECEELGSAAVAVVAEATDEAAVNALADAAVDHFGRLDVWVNAAAVGQYAAVHEAPVDEVRRLLDVNIMGYVLGARAALAVMRRQRSGVIVNVSSVAARVPQPYTSAYSMSKAAVRALGSSLRSELMLEGLTHVHVVTVQPAAVDTPFFTHAANHTGRQVLAMPPVYRPEKIAAAIVRGSRKPRAEVVVGAIPKALVLERRSKPLAAEKAMAVQVETTHLSPTRPAGDTSGILFDARNARTTVDGGWSGTARTGLRRGLAVVALLAIGGVIVGRRLRAA